MPPVRWATTSDGLSLGFQVFGTGSVDVVAIPPFAQNIELAWERPELRRVWERIGRFARVVHFDKRGTGVSDRSVPVPGLDQRVDDARAVMDAAGVDRAVLYGISEGGPMALLFAVTYPERVERLVLHATDARIVDRDGMTDEDLELLRWGPEGVLTHWGTEQSGLLRLLAPTAWADPDYRAWEPRYERHSATPAAIRDLLAMADSIDVREILGRITVPTLLLHVRGDPVIPIERVRETAAAIPGARLVEHDGIDHFPHVGETDWWLDEVERFVTGAVAPRRSRPPVGRTTVRTLGGFDVLHDGTPVAVAEWAIAPRDRARRAVLGALQRLAATTDNTAAVDHLQRAVDLDPLGAGAHEQLVKVLHAGGRLGEARRAHDRYTAVMSDLGAPARPLVELTT